MRSAYFVVVCFVAAVAGCGGKSRDQSQYGSQAGASDAAGNAGHVSNAGASGSGASGAGGGGQTAECASFVDAKPLAVPVLIRNNLTYAIHLGPRADNCSETPLFLVQDAAGQQLNGLGPCRTPCDTVLAGDPVGGCLPVCPMLSTVTLAPRQSVSIAWAGLSDVESDLPQECIPKRSDGIDLGSHCEHSLSIPSGSYVFSAQAGTALDCSATSTSGCEACTPDADGQCRTSNALVSGTVLGAQTMVEVDAAGQNATVTLVFEE